MKLNVKTIGSKVLAAAAAIAVVSTSAIQARAEIAVVSDAGVAAKALAASEAGALRTLLTTNTAFAGALQQAGALAILKAAGNSAITGAQLKLLQNALSKDAALSGVIAQIAKGLPADAAAQASYFAKLQNLSVNEALGVVAASTNSAIASTVSQAATDEAMVFASALESKGRELGVNMIEAAEAIRSVANTEAAKNIGLDNGCVAHSFKTAEGVERVGTLAKALKGMKSFVAGSAALVAKAKAMYQGNVKPACAGLMSSAARRASELAKNASAATCQIFAISQTDDAAACGFAAAR